jgi:peptide/nickel transport system permease protein
MELWRGVIASRLAAFGVAAVGIVIAMALMAPLLVPHDPAAQDILNRLLPPLARSEAGFHLLGTDALGRDLLSRVIVGSRVSLLVGVAAVAVSAAVGITIGLISGYDDGALGRALMGLADVQLAVPFLVLILAVIAVLGPSLVNLILVLGVAHWVQYARVVRAEALALREREFVQAAQALGAGATRILVRHLLPNLMSSIIVISSLLLARMILYEASLSFLGLGVPARIATWGAMIADGRSYMGNAWWVAAIPGLAIFVTVVAINLVGDRLRDLLDPKLRHAEK